MKKILFSISVFLMCQHFIKAQQQVLTAVELIPQTSITVTSPGATTGVYPGSLITCNWTCNSDIRFGSLVNVLLVTQAQRSDLLAGCLLLKAVQMPMVYVIGMYPLRWRKGTMQWW